MAETAVAAFLLDGRGGCQVIDKKATLDQSSPANPLWVHIDYTKPQAEEWLKEQNRLDPLVVESLLSQDSRPRSSAFQNGLLMGLRGVNFNPGAAPEDMVAIRLWVENSLIISSSQRPLATLDELHKNLARGKGPVSVSSFLIELITGVSDHIAESLDELENDFESLELPLTQEEFPEVRVQLAALRRTAISLRRYLQPQRDALVHLQNETVPWLTKNDKLSLRENTNRMYRYIEELDSIIARASIIQEELSSRVAEQINRRMYTLSLVATIFMPLSFLTGLFGMNVGGIPGNENRYGFFITSLWMIVVIILLLFYLKRKKWF